MKICRHGIFFDFKDSMKFKVLQGLYWSSWAFYYMYLVYYLNELRGYNPASIGIITSATAVANLVFTGIWGIVTDKVKDIKKILTILFICATVLISTFPLHPSIISIGIAMVFIAIFEPCIPLIIDSWIAQYAEKCNNLCYGRIRVWGSICFIGAALVVGKIAKTVNVEITFHMHIITALLCIFVLRSIKFNAKEVKIRENARSNVYKNVTVLFKNADYAVFVLCSTLVFMVSKYTVSFLPLKIVEVGGSESHVSLIWVIATITEIPVLIYIKKIVNKFKFSTLLLISFSVSLLRIFLLYISNSVVQVIFAHSLQGVTYSLFLAVSVLYLNSIAPIGMKTSAIAIASACYGGISGIAGSSLGGFLIDNYGLDNSYTFGMGMNIIAVFLFCTYYYIGGRRRTLNT